MQINGLAITFKYTLRVVAKSTEIEMSTELDRAIDRFTTLTCEILDNGLQTIEAINSGLSMIAAAEQQARNEMRAKRFTSCLSCQSGLVVFLNDTPHADDETTQAVNATLWETCQTCQAEYAAHLAKDTCRHGVRNSFENCETCLNEWADANAPDETVIDNESEWEKRNLYCGGAA